MRFDGACKDLYSYEYILGQDVEGVLIQMATL